MMISTIEEYIMSEHDFNSVSQNSKSMYFATNLGSVAEMDLSIPIKVLEARLQLSQRLEVLAGGPIWVEFIEDKDKVKISGRTVSMRELVSLLEQNTNISHLTIPEE